MRISALSHYAFGSYAAVAMLAGCGGSQPPIAAPGAVPQASPLLARASTTNHKIVYSLRGGSDGAKPLAGLTDVGGTLYGTTDAGGGSGGCTSGSGGCGTVFSVTSSGTEKVLHAFGATGDGLYPRASLLDVGGTLYGTTTLGGSGGGSYPCPGSTSSSYVPCGTVFSVTPSGTEKVLYTFSGFYGGGLPYAPLIDVKGTLYGTTEIGGGDADCAFKGGSCGTAFSITTAGAEKALHYFNGLGSSSEKPDGALPYAGLIDVKGMLYGTTAAGGKHRGGTVFSITTSGAEKVLHDFGAGSDGSSPVAGLILLHGKLYGTTDAGGASSCHCGTVFSVTPGGTEKVLHSFSGYPDDGADPWASLIALKGKLYGTTVAGGTYGCHDLPNSSVSGCGTAFSITPAGTETIIYSFGGDDSDASPYAGLLDVKGTLYGTTELGGAHGYGTVFSLTP
jgi:uncharacterized repeat protein (TIGR03803 family)